MMQLIQETHYAIGDNGLLETLTELIKSKRCVMSVTIQRMDGRTPEKMEYWNRYLIVTERVGD